jgi:hypothetical protein
MVGVVSGGVVIVDDELIYINILYIK